MGTGSPTEAPGISLPDITGAGGRCVVPSGAAVSCRASKESRDPPIVSGRLRGGGMPSVWGPVGCPAKPWPAGSWRIASARGLVFCRGAAAAGPWEAGAEPKPDRRSEGCSGPEPGCSGPEGGDSMTAGGLAIPPPNAPGRPGIRGWTGVAAGGAEGGVPHPAAAGWAGGAGGHDAGGTAGAPSKGGAVGCPHSAPVGGLAGAGSAHDDGGSGCGATSGGGANAGASGAGGGCEAAGDTMC